MIFDFGLICLWGAGFLRTKFRLYGKAYAGMILFLVAISDQVHATQVIANWDAVPYQCLSQPFKLGVVAFHETGVDVEFRINGESAGRISDPSWNDRTGVFEYWIEICPARYADGPLIISATAYPDGASHESRTLVDLTLYSNSSNSLISPLIKWVDASLGSDTAGDGSEALPYQTIKKAVLSVGDGGTVYLKAGTNYTLSSINGQPFTYWTTITAAPGLGADDVHIGTYLKDNSGSTGQYNQSGIRWGKVSLFCDRAPGWGSLLYLNGNRTWFDGTVFYDKNGPNVDTVLFHGAGAQPYLTDCYVHDIANGGGLFQRNVRFQNIGADIYRGADNLTAINVTVRNMNKGETSAHPDFIQFYHDAAETVENVILYNCKVYDMMAQGIFGTQGGGVKDAAFINLLLEKDPADVQLFSQVSGAMDHILLWNATFVDQPFIFKDTTDLQNWDVCNCVFDTVSAGTNSVLPNNSNISHAHAGSLTWQQQTPLGTAATVGNPLYVDSDNDDYRLLPASPAYSTGTLHPGVPADIDGYLYDPVSPNRGAFSRSNPGNTASGTNVISMIGVTFDYDTSDVVLVRTYFNGTEQRDRIKPETSCNLLSWEELAPRFTNAEGFFEVAELVHESPRSRFYRFRHD